MRNFLIILLLFCCVPASAEIGSTWIDGKQVFLAEDVSITDSGSFFTGTEVEAALQEIGAGTTLGSHYLKLDQSTPQTITSGSPIFSAGITLSDTQPITFSPTDTLSYNDSLGTWAFTVNSDTILTLNTTEANFDDNDITTSGTLGAGAITGTSFTDGTATLTGGNLTGMGNITGTDVDLSLGTGNITTTGKIGIGIAPSYPLHIQQTSTLPSEVRVQPTYTAPGTSVATLYVYPTIDSTYSGAGRTVQAIYAWLYDQGTITSGIAHNLYGNRGSIWKQTASTGASRISYNTYALSFSIIDDSSHTVGYTSTETSKYIKHFGTDITITDRIRFNPATPYFWAVENYGTRIKIDANPVNTGANTVDVTNYGISLDIDYAKPATGTFNVINYGIYNNRITGGDTNYFLYDANGVQNILSGNTRIGGLTDPAVALDVTGAGLISSTFGVTGLLTATGGISIPTTEDIQFRDAQITIASLDDGNLDLTADINIDLNAPAINLLGNTRTRDVIPVTDDTYYLGEWGSPFKSYKGLMLKDTADGKHYLIRVTNGVITAAAAD